MKKVFKIVSISLASLLFVLLLIISLGLWLVFTPEKITPIVQKQAAKYLSCQSEFDSVELTFFSTYPNFGLKIKHFVLINPVNDSPNDTLIAIDQLTGIIDFQAWWKHNDIIIKELMVNTGTLTLFYDSVGTSNLDIFPPDTSTMNQTTDSQTFEADIENIHFENLNIAYIDYTLPVKAILTGLKGKMNGKLQTNIFQSKLILTEGIVSLEYDGESYLQNVSTQFDMNFDYFLSHLKMNISHATGTLNQLPIWIKGYFEEDSTTLDMIFDMAFKLDDSPADQVIKMVPPYYKHYFEGITASGILTADGTMKGVMNQTAMPMFNIHMLINNGNAKYKGLALELQQINGDLTVVTDAMTDSLTYLKIDWLNAKTKLSSFKINGLVDQLFSDINCRLSTNMNLALGEFNSLIPANMKTKVNGQVNGQVKAHFTLTQLEKSQFDQINISGNLALTNFDVTYDTLWANTKSTKINFSLPNKKGTISNTAFLKFNIDAENLNAGAKNNYKAGVGKTIVALETSYVLDSTQLPHFICSFAVDSLTGNMDTIRLAVSATKGKMAFSPGTENPDHAQIKVSGIINTMDTQLGKEKLALNHLNFDVEVENRPNEKNILLQWPVKGFIDMEQGMVSTTSLAYPIGIPSIKMNFDPENFNIIESKVDIDKSDFQLTGNVSNLLSYFRGDSILRGNLTFGSETTDVVQLMALTNGMGSEEPITDTIYTGPYMVPKGIDFSLSTNIKQALFETGSASNIKGKVVVRDGLLVLDDLRLNTPATRIQLTAMYRTPRKNHLYLGIDYHMLDIEIEELLKMVPDIDSIMPMLRSFSGSGEFHMAAETYLDSLYNLKKSTLRGAASITGEDLVLLDGETFSEIAKSLKFNKKTENKVDSLSAEFTVFKNEIDVYPFLIVMDKYKAIVAGRHNLDMSFDYHISVVDCPLPVKLGLDVQGKPDNLSYRISKCQYADYYRPSARYSVANKQLELRKLIHNTLVEKVKSD